MPTKGTHGDAGNANTTTQSAATPQPTMNLEAFFAETGEMLPADTVSSDAIANNIHTAEEWLATMAPNVLEMIESFVDSHEFSRQELINRHVKKETLEREARGQPVVPSKDVFVTVNARQEREPLHAADNTDTDESAKDAVCETHGDVKVSSESFKQLRSADEPETRIVTFSCGCTKREDN